MSLAGARCWLVAVSGAALMAPVPSHGRSFLRRRRTRQPDVSYADVTAAAGLAGFRHVSGSAEKSYLIETTGSGVAMADFDDDGLVDIYLVNGSTLDRVRGLAGARRRRCFATPATARSATSPMRPVSPTNGGGRASALGDFDNDGREDFYVANFGPNRLYRSLGHGRFVDVAGSGRRGGEQLVHGLCVRRLRWRRLAGSLRRGLCGFRCEDPPPAPGAAIRRN